MNIKKIGSKIFGANFTAAEQKALDMEVKRQLAEYDRMHSLEIEALHLWVLHEKFGFGKKRAREFHDSIRLGLLELLDRYEMDDPDAPWLCLKKLKDDGIDLEKWVEEETE